MKIIFFGRTIYLMLIKQQNTEEIYFLPVYFPAFLSLANHMPDYNTFTHSHTLQTYIATLSNVRSNILK